MKIITAKELKAKIDEGFEGHIINALSQEYYNDCHIPGSINAPASEIETLATAWDKNKEYVVHCAHSECNAGEKACNILTKMGFENVFDYKGGIKEWKAKGYDCQGSCSLEYLQ